MFHPFKRCIARTLLQPKFALIAMLCCFSLFHLVLRARIHAITKETVVEEPRYNFHYAKAISPRPPPRPPPRPIKTILYFTQWWGTPDFGWGEGSDLFKTLNCPIQACFATSDRNYLSSMGDFDAVLFHGHEDQVSYVEYQRIASWRKSQQRFVVMPLESASLPGNIIPARGRDMRHFQEPRDPYDDFFNWTMSYRWDADIVRPYGWFTERGSQDFYPSLPNWVPYDKDQFITALEKKPQSFWDLARRPKMVAWITSKCNVSSSRREYVDELKKHISVDIFGGCGEIPCDQVYSPTTSDDSCSRAVREQYKFYLSFENSLCNDYVTEKFFTRMTNNLVVVLGQANYSRLAPPHSHLNVMDYASPKELADHMHRLANDEREYLSYFWWQDYYSVTQTEQPAHDQAICHLCEKLHDTSAAQSTTYSDLQGWWNEKENAIVICLNFVSNLGIDAIGDGYLHLHDAFAQRPPWS